MGHSRKRPKNKSRKRKRQKKRLQRGGTWRPTTAFQRGVGDLLLGIVSASTVAALSMMDKKKT